MTFLRPIIVATIIFGIAGARFPNYYIQEGSDSFSHPFIGKQDYKDENHQNVVEGATILKSFPKTRLASKVEHQQSELDELLSKSKDEPLEFSDKRGRLLILTDGRRTLTRINPLGEVNVNALAFTSRPLQDDELLEITILEKNAEDGENYFLSIGVTTEFPEKIKEVPTEILGLIAPGWFLYGVQGFLCASKKCVDIDGVKLPRNGKVNDTLGVRMTSGTIRFFFNQDLIGLVDTEFYGEVYGVVDLEYNVDKIAITS
ncbi:uncharacterized protein LOC124166005 [Ischnura elegans]|uniref:uncharacterized protein LOC124166005 n=1 Tax=Ischnura elegans TaxID=197161 RepID=UPI001ED8A988|nr:uncharacterized protein LOC124166005 [Ischnura elegans]